MARLGRVTVVVVSLGLVLTACGAAREAAPAADPPATSVRAVESAVESAVPAPVAVPEKLAFTAKTVDGKDFAGESLFGAPAVLWFWTPWCPNCRAEAPAIAAAAKESGVRFVGVAAQDGIPAMRDFVDQYQLGGFPHLADTDLAVWRRFGVRYQPAYAFVSATGEVEVATEPLEKDDLLARVRALG